MVHAHYEILLSIKKEWIISTWMEIKGILWVKTAHPKRLYKV